MLFRSTVLEAMAAGVPVVANDSGGTRELIRDGATGLLLPTVSPPGIAAALQRLLANPRLAQKMAARAHRQVQRD